MEILPIIATAHCVFVSCMLGSSVQVFYRERERHWVRSNAELWAVAGRDWYRRQWQL